MNVNVHEQLYLAYNIRILLFDFSMVFSALKVACFFVFFR